MTTPGSEWKPISTAPHNEQVLLYCPERGVTNHERIELDYASHGRRVGSTSSVSAHSWATHWQPLPLPPGDAKGRDVNPETYPIPAPAPRSAMREETSTVIERWTPPENEADPLPDPPGWKQAAAEELSAHRAAFFADNDTVERVAKAIWDTGVNEQWETAFTSRKDHYRRCARAAIAAIPSTPEQPRHDRSEERE